MIRNLVLLLLWVFLPSGVSAQESVFKMHVLNAGYGDSILLQFPDHKTMLIDAGTKESSSAINTYLKSIELERIQAAIITHPHQNHFQGFAGIIKEFPVDEFYVNGDHRADEGYQDLLMSFKRLGIPTRELAREDQLFDGRIKVLHPDRLTDNVNGNSIALMVTYKENSFLLLADIGLEQINNIISFYPEVKNADVIQIPHHGKSMDPDFINNFQNKIFIISTGPSQWGLPDEALVEKLKGRVFRTDRHGTIVLESDGEQVKVSHE